MIRGLAYVPGRVRGVVARRTAVDAILVTEQASLPLSGARPAGCVLVDGAPFSHAAISLFAAGVPTVMLDRGAADSLRVGDDVVLDGALGSLEPAGDVATGEPAAGSLTAPPDIELRASVRDVAGAARARESGAVAIGLVRSEFLLPAGAALPDTGYYVEALAALARAAGPLTIDLRLLDLAADKRPAWAAALPSSGPLGLQGVRLFDQEPVARVVRAQIDAVAALSTRERFRLILPYVTDPDEFVHHRDWIAGRLPTPIAIGAMVETPAAALAIDDLLEVADFVSIGTNDLMQCLFAADRDRPELRSWLSAYSPALFRFLRLIAERAGHRMERLQVCGVLAQLPGVLSVVRGLGFRNYSVDPVSIPHLAASAAQSSPEDAIALASDVTACRSSRQVLERLGGVPGQGIDTWS